MLAIREKPDRVDLGARVRTDRGQVPKGSTGKDVLILLRNRSLGHGGFLFPPSSGPRRHLVSADRISLPSHRRLRPPRWIPRRLPRSSGCDPFRVSRRDALPPAPVVPM